MRQGKQAHLKVFLRIRVFLHTKLLCITIMTLSSLDMQVQVQGGGRIPE